jgi:TIR domain
VNSRDDHRGHAFISHDPEDGQAADWLQHTLEAAGIRVWRDAVDLLPGQDRRAEIRKAISEGALVFIACFSRFSLNRSGGLRAGY